MRENEGQRGKVTCPGSHSWLVIELEEEPQGSEKPVEVEGPECIKDEKVSLERSAELEERGN